MDKTTVQAQAVSALTPMTEVQIIDMLKQEFNIQRAMIAQLLEDQRVVEQRIRYGNMAVLADMLSRYYQTRPENEAAQAAEDWAYRATRYYARAFQRRNTIVRNIGGVET